MSLRVNRGAAIVLAVAGSVIWSIHAAMSRTTRDEAPWRMGALEGRIETQPSMTGRLEDRAGRVLAQPVFENSLRGGRWVIDRPYGPALADAGLGRELLLPYGVQGSVSGVTRTGADAMRPYESVGPVARALVGSPLLTAPALPTLRTTLDAELSVRIYEILRRQGTKSSAVVLDAISGAVLALVDYPGPDVTSSVLPNGKNGLDALYGFNLPASTMKALSASYILAKRPGDANNAHDCDGYRCWTRHGRVRNLEDAVVQSCNTWFRLESAKWDRADWLAFVMDTGLQPVDAPGLPLSPLIMVGHHGNQMHWEHAIGQQVWVSIIGLASAYATITSLDGHRVNPFVVINMGQERGRPQVVAPTVSKRLREVLWTNGRIGTAKIVNQVYVKGDAGGKTGTGERDGATSDAVFAAVAPWDRPRWIVVSSLRGGGRGVVAGRVAGEILNQIASQKDQR